MTSNTLALALGVLTVVAPAFGFDFPGVHDPYREFLGAQALTSLQPLRDALEIPLYVCPRI
jgi:hypothetical protein